MEEVLEAPPRRTYRTRMFDSSRWDHIALRPDDIVVATWAKSGTTLTQQIVWQLISGAADGVAASSASPWVDVTFQMPLEPMVEMLEGQVHRRFMKTHLPFDGLPYNEDVRYVFIGRDPRDVLWSAYDHMRALSPAAWAAINAVPAETPPWTKFEGSVREYYNHWLDTDTTPGFHDLSFWDCVQSWWEARRRPNVFLLHYANLIADIPGETHRLAGFLDIEVDEAIMPRMVEHCTLSYMREQARGSMLDMFFERGPNSFFNKGVNGRWRDILSEPEIARADKIARERLGPDCARWLTAGGIPV